MQCTFAGCKNKVLALGLCTGHYQQKRNGKGLSPLKNPLSDSYPVIDGKKPCRTCGKVKPVSEFYHPKGRQLTLDCKSCYSKKVVDRRG